MPTPSKLRPGAMVRRKDRPDAPVYVFVKRLSGWCRCRCDAYRGQWGPDDTGLVDVSDWDMARHYELITPTDRATH